MRIRGLGAALLPLLVRQTPCRHVLRQTLYRPVLQPQPFRQLSTSFTALRLEGSSLKGTRFTKDAEEIFYSRCYEGDRDYYVDLKRDAVTGTRFFKISEVSATTRLRSSLLIGLNDMDRVLEALESSKNDHPMEEPYATVKSSADIFEEKEFAFILFRKAEIGYTVEIHERLGSPAGKPIRIVIEESGVHLVAAKIKEVLQFAKSTG